MCGSVPNYNGLSINQSENAPNRQQSATIHSEFQNSCQTACRYSSPPKGFFRSLSLAYSN